MGYLGEYENIYGVKDVFGYYSEEEDALLFQNTKDALVEKEIVFMDFDGEYHLRNEYQTFVQECCDCNSCLTMTMGKTGLKSYSYVFWKRDNHYTMAEIIDGEYVVSKTDKDLIMSYITPYINYGQNSVFEENSCKASVIANVDLKRARDFFLKEKKEDMCRVFEQNCVTKKIYDVIEDVFKDNATYMSIGLVKNQGQILTLKKNYMSSSGTVLEHKSSVMNFRVFSEFIQRDGNKVEDEIRQTVSLFFE